MDDNCVFCSIIDGELPAFIVFENERVIAFLDAEPVSEGHTLVLPKKHVETVHDAEEMKYMWKPLVSVSNAIRESLDPRGINIAQNNGDKAGQEVFHLHFHVTPVYTGDELDIQYNRSALENGEEVAETIKSEIT